MVKNKARVGRLGDHVQRELAGLIRSEVNDPRVGLVTVTGVEISADYQHAQVFFTSLNGAEAAQDALSGLQRASGFLRSRLARSLNTRTVPELEFVYDDSIERGARLSQLIDEAVGKPANED